VSAGHLDETEIHDVLSNERRRRVLVHLHERAPQELSVLAEEIAAEETEQRPPPRNKRNSVYITLHQTHLPKLDDLGIVEYDDRKKTVALGARADDLLVDRTEEASPEDRGPTPWTGVYTTLVGVGLVLTGATQFGVAPFDAVAGETVAVTTLVVLMIVLAYRIGAVGVGVPTPLRSLFE
jgi:hypothetical protein